MTTDNEPKPPLSTIPLTQVRNVRELLINDGAKKQLAAVAASTLSPDRMLKLLANAIRTTPRLADCEPMSLLGALMTASSLGLEVNTVLGHAYLVPFKNKRKKITEAQLIIGYKGYVDLARRSGHIVSIHADVVYEDDEFSSSYGTNGHLHHVANGKRKNPQKAYAYAKLTDGEAYFVWPYSLVLELRDTTQGYQKALRDLKNGNKWAHDEAAWVKHEHQMAAKTMILRLKNELPLSIEMAKAYAADEHKIDYAAYARSKNPDQDAPTDVLDGIDYTAEVIDDDMIDDEDSGSDTGTSEKKTGGPKDKPKDPPADNNPSSEEDEPSGDANADVVAEEIINALADADTPEAATKLMSVIYADEYKALPAKQSVRVLDAARAKGYES